MDDILSAKMTSVGRMEMGNIFVLYDPRSWGCWTPKPVSEHRLSQSMNLIYFDRKLKVKMLLLWYVLTSITKCSNILRQATAYSME